MKAKDIQAGKDYAVIRPYYGRVRRDTRNLEGIPAGFKPYLKRAKVVEVRTKTVNAFNPRTQQEEPKKIIDVIVKWYNHDNKLTEQKDALPLASIVTEWETYKPMLKKYNDAIEKERLAQEEARDKAYKKAAGLEQTLFKKLKPFLPKGAKQENNVVIHVNRWNDDLFEYRFSAEAIDVLANKVSFVKN